MTYVIILFLPYRQLFVSIIDQYLQSMIMNDYQDKNFWFCDCFTTMKTSHIESAISTCLHAR